MMAPGVLMVRTRDALSGLLCWRPGIAPGAARPAVRAPRYQLAAAATLAAKAACSAESTRLSNTVADADRGSGCGRCCPLCHAL